MTLHIRPTEEKDLEHVMSLWHDGEVMRHVGFPQGLDHDLEQMKTWFARLKQNPRAAHFGIFDDDEYLGESFYRVLDGHDLAAMDIKLFAKGRGKGAGTTGLGFALDALFENKLAEKAYVDPHPDNLTAIALYERLGFTSQPRPAFLDPHPTYYELDRATWLARKPDRLRLRQVTRHDYLDIVRLQVKDDQKNFVASNMYSLVQAAYEPGSEPRGIYIDNLPVGFLMYGIDDEDHQYWIIRLMIDARFQGRGYGRIAMTRVIDTIKEDPDHHRIMLSFEPDNIIAKTLYESLGFVSTGRYHDDEIIYQLEY
ncbi:MAG: GNAT family N-acetyltransferase [Acholeplasmataceae bacterium]|nr:MAG: GNAT family N-acetyltransferase [Acholeplasmataceae bacterium]